MQSRDNTPFDPATISLLRAVLDQAWNSLSLAERRLIAKSELAERILKSAALGERDPHRLRAEATTDLHSKDLHSKTADFHKAR
jgi:hypothetical protein